MSFFSNAVQLISKIKKSKAYDSVATDSLEMDLNLRNYVKESFSVLIVRPLSGCILKIMGTASSLITGTIIGTVIALLCFFVLIQFSSIENSLLSSFIMSKFEKLFPESDLTVKSASLRWNSHAKAFEILLNRVRLDDLSIPSVSILPDYRKSLQSQYPILKNVSIMNAKINLDVANDFKTFSINPNFEKGGGNKALLEPLSSYKHITKFLKDGVNIKLLNTDVLVSENGAEWRFKNVYCEHIVGETSPQMINCALILPGQSYVSNINLVKENFGQEYSVKIESLNPYAINAAFLKRDTPIDKRILDAISGYNLPVSGEIKLNFEKDEFLGGTFDLYGSSGSIKLPVRNTLSLNLGKKIDHGSISGNFSRKQAKIDSLNISYGNSGLQLTGINVPLGEFKFLDVANVNGTLSLTNIDTQEMENILPANIARSAILSLKNYLPGFKLELFKIDLKGVIAFNDRNVGEELNIGRGVFKIKDAKIPVGEDLVTNIIASGNILENGIDIRLSNAFFRETKINKGVFFISNKDNSWTGTINADVTLNDIATYAKNISPKLALMPLGKLNIDGLANMDMKLAQLTSNEKRYAKDLPFKIMEGNGVIRSAENTKELRLSWNDKHLFISGDAVTGKNRISIQLKENLVNHSGSGELYCVSDSDFINALVYPISNICKGNYSLKVNSFWSGEKEDHDLTLDLKDATMFVPLIGDLKLRKDEGKFTAHVSKNDGCYEFSNIDLNTKDNKIKGKITLDEKGNLLKCHLNHVGSDESSTRINILKDGENKMLFSAVGDSVDLNKARSTFDKIDNNVLLSGYIDLKEMVLTDFYKLKNIKGNLDIRNGKIINGACYATIGEETTLALTAKESANDVLISLSASNAGEFLKCFRLTDTANGGSINLVIKMNLNADQSFSGAFEMNDFIIKNNELLSRLVTLSSTGWIPNTDSMSIGFNHFVGKFVVAGTDVIIEDGKGVGPTIAMTYRGKYSRETDTLQMNGFSIPMSSILNSQNSNEFLSADFQISGSIGMPSMSVKPLKYIDGETVKEAFGSMLPVVPGIPSINDNIVPRGDIFTDPFSQKAFDRRINESKHTNIVLDPTNDNDQEIKAPVVTSKKPHQKKSTDKKTGVTIIRGIKSPKRKIKPLHE
ncbi:MAG: hypothetical protein LBF57_03930 [Holosporaceae bacterium]|jgi:hypothetical protein|nr:hypothetical protein [Holosporaceae bacterium]